MGHEVYQGDPAYTEQHEIKRGQEMWADKEGFHKELVDENAKLPEPETPEYLKLHERVLAGENPYKAQRELAAPQHDHSSSVQVPEENSEPAPPEPVPAVEQPEAAHTEQQVAE